MISKMPHWFQSNQNVQLSILSTAPSFLMVKDQPIGVSFTPPTWVPGWVSGGLTRGQNLIFLRLSNTKVGITNSLSKYAKMVKLGMMFNLYTVLSHYPRFLVFHMTMVPYASKLDRERNSTDSYQIINLLVCWSRFQFMIHYG